MCRIILLILFVFFSGCTVFPKKQIDVPDIKDPVYKKEKQDTKNQWKVVEGKEKPVIKRGGVPVDLQFDQIDLKDIVSLLMGMAKENYVAADNLIGLVDIEVKGRYSREDLLEIVRTILKSKNYEFIKKGSIYGIYNIAEDDGVLLHISPDEDKSVYIYHLQYSESKSLKPILNDIFPDIMISDNQNENILIIRCFKNEYKNVRDVINQFDKKPKQVLVEFTILEVTLTDGLRYGVEYFFNKGKHRGGNISLLTDGIQQASGALPIVDGGLRAFMFQKDFDSFVTMLATESRVDIISKPNVLVQDGKSSTIKIGREEPIKRGQSVSSNGQTSEDIAYRDVGVILNVKVHIEENNVVQLYLREEVSEVIESNVDPIIDSPSFSNKVIELNTLLNDGQKIYIGGLMESNKSKLVKKVPLLGDIPFIGKAFRSENMKTTKTELILLVSVEVLFNDADINNQRLRFVREYNGY